MQYFELLLITSTTLYLFFFRLVKTKLNKRYLIFLLLFLLVLHLGFDGYRWQMIPVYLVWLITFLTALSSQRKKTSKALKFFKIAGLSIIVILALILPTVLPVFKLPEPTGPYHVGTQDILLELDREEIITTDISDKRQLMIKAWYPSKETSGENDPYIDQAGRSGFARKYGLPASSMNYLDKIKTHVYRDLKIAEGQFPVLIFSHGYNSKANGYYAIISEIVSHGYIVFSVNHTFESTGSTFPDGSEVYFDFEYAQKIESGTWKTMEPVIEAFKSDLSFEQRHPIVKKGLTTYFVRDMVERWADDINDVVRKLEDWNNTGYYQGKMDLANVGVFGHSRGGGAAGEALLINDKIKAGANLDGVQWGKIVDTAFDKPFLFLSADWPEDHEDLNGHAYINKSTSIFYEGLIRQSGHSNFMDIPHMIPLKALSQAGDIDPDLATEMTTKLIISVFDKHLKNKKIDVNALALAYPMLELKIHQGDSLINTNK